MFIPYLYSELYHLPPAIRILMSAGVSPPACEKRKIAFKGIYLRSKPFCASENTDKGTKNK